MGTKFRLFSWRNSLLVICLACITSCNKDNEEKANVTPLPKMNNVSLNYKSSSQVITLARNVESDGAIVKLKKGVSWINNIRLSGKTLSFDVEENTTSDGHRFDTLAVVVKGRTIGTICVTQARNPFSMERLQWANANARYRHEAISNSDLSGLEMTKLVYNLEKTTNGRDSYKNYPAFAFCIEMNHDPEHNMEWYLPSEREIRSYQRGDSYVGTPIAKHNYWWSSSENHYYEDSAYNVYSGSVASRGSVSKGGSWWVVAFRNGKIEE